MSAIVDKPYAPKGAIFRTEFKGNPNLFTAADLNRQIQQFTEVIRKIENRVGLLGHLHIAPNQRFSGGKYSVSVNVGFSYAGSYFEGEPSLECSIEPDGVVYLVGTANVVEKSLSDDGANHDIGAWFANDSVAAAANQVYLEWSFSLEKPNKVLGSDLAVVLAKITFSGTTSCSWESYVYEDQTSLTPTSSALSNAIASKVNSAILSLKNELAGPIKVDYSYDEETSAGVIKIKDNTIYIRGSFTKIDIAGGDSFECLIKDLYHFEGYSATKYLDSLEGMVIQSEGSTVTRNLLSIGSIQIDTDSGTKWANLILYSKVSSSSGGVTTTYGIGIAVDKDSFPVGTYTGFWSFVYTCPLPW